METVLHETRGAVTLSTLNRPEKLNALNYAMIDRLMARLDAAEADPSVGAVILTGAGRAFSAGGDIPEFSASIERSTEEAVREFSRRGQAMTARLETFPKPVIAAVNGLAYGGGCEITEAAHLAIAASDARFAKPEITLGIPPTFGGTQRLPRIAGRKRALELLLTGESFSADRALDLGLVNAVVPAPDLLPAALDLAARILRHAPQTTARILAAVTRGLNAPMGEGLEIERAEFARICGTEATRDGLTGWLNRRAS